VAPRTNRSLSSCFECAGIAHCYGCKQPDLDREAARAAAAECTSLRKGRTTETVYVLGRRKGISRKKAEKLVMAGMATWEAHRTVRMIGACQDLSVETILKKRFRLGQGLAR